MYESHLYQNQAYSNQVEDSTAFDRGYSQASDSRAGDDIKVTSHKTTPTRNTPGFRDGNTVYSNSQQVDNPYSFSPSQRSNTTASKRKSPMRQFP